MPTKRQVRRKRTRTTRATPVAVAPLIEQPAIEPVAPPAPPLTDRVGVRVRRIVDSRAFVPVTLGAIFCASVVAYILIGRQHLVPDLFPDEMFYGKLSQNFAAGHGLQWRGTGWGLPPVWPVLLSVVWHFGSAPEGYAVGKVLTATLISTVVFPVWLLARVFVGPRLALVPTALSVMGAWMFVASFLVSENLAYPLAAASLACTVMALRDLRLRWIAGSAACAIVAAGARTQMLSLLVILVVSLVGDVLRQPKGTRRARIAARPRALWIGLIVVVGAILLTFIAKPDLTNYDVLSHHASLGAVAKTTGRHATSMVVMFAFIPVVAVLALMARARNWRDDQTGPVLVTIAAGVLVLLPLLGRFEVWATQGLPVDRYGMYLAPLFMLGLVMAPGRIGRRTAVIAAIGVTVCMFGVPVARNFIEQPAVYGIEERLFEIASYFHHHLPLGVFLVCLPVAIAGALALTSKRHAALGLGIAVVLTGGMLVVQNWTSQKLEIKVERDLAPGFITKPYDWVDRAATGPVAMLAVGQGEPMRGNPDLYTEFFNPKIKTLFSTIPVGVDQCQLDFLPRGYLKQDAGCPAWPRNLVLLERSVGLTFYGQHRLAVRPNGALIHIPPGRPRVFSAIQPPCTLEGCTGTLKLGFYLDHPARVAVTFSGTDKAHRIQAGKQVSTMPPGQPSTIRFNLAKGDQGANIGVDWNTPDGPQLQSIYVRTGGRTIHVY